MSKKQQNLNLPYMFLGLITGLLPVWMILLGLDAMDKLSRQTGVTAAIVTIVVVMSGVVVLAFGGKNRLS